MAYALVVSLKQIIKPFLDSVRLKIQIPNLELNFIYYDLCYLKSFFDKINSLEDSNSVEDLERQIKNVVQNTQDLIDFHVSDLVDSRPESSVSGFSQELVEVKDKLGSIVKLVKAKDHYLTGVQEYPSGFGRNNEIVRLAGRTRTDAVSDREIVGLEDELMRLLLWLFGGYSKLQVISIIGMVGVGKTTLAKAAYLHPLSNEHFDIRLFVEIDLEYELKEVLLGLLGQLASAGCKKVTVEQLGMTLYQHLFNRSYLVVLDDSWDTRAWTELRRFLPDNGNGSGIILITRIANVARGAWSEETIISKRFLNNEEIWELLSKMALSDMEVSGLEQQLKEIGKTIAKCLGGLPLAIVMIGKLLSKSDRTEEN